MKALNPTRCLNVRCRCGKIEFSAIVAIVSAIAAIASAVYAWQSKNAAWSGNQIALNANKVASDALERQSAWQRGDLHHQLLDLLTELNYLEATSASDDETGCGTGEVCLGGLAFTDDSLRRYETATMHALAIAEQLTNELDAAVWLELADSTYVTGRLDKTVELVARATKSNDYLVKYRAELLLAQCAFMRRELEGGSNHIKNAIGIAENARNSIPATELALRRARAHLTCGAMHLTLGKREEAVMCFRTAAESIDSLPDMRRRADLSDELDGLLEKYVKSAKSTKMRTFDERLKEAEEREKEESTEAAPAEAGS